MCSNCRVWLKSFTLTELPVSGTFTFILQALKLAKYYFLQKQLLFTFTWKITVSWSQERHYFISKLFISLREEKNVGNSHQTLSAGLCNHKSKNVRVFFLFFFFFVPSGWTRWWKRGELSFLPKALHGFVAERSEVHSDDSRHEEVSPPPSSRNVSWPSGLRVFTQNSIKRQSERENGWFPSLIQTMSHLSKVCWLLRSWRRSAQRALCGFHTNTFFNVCFSGSLLGTTPDLEALKGDWLLHDTATSGLSHGFLAPSAVLFSY